MSDPTAPVSNAVTDLNAVGPVASAGFGPRELADAFRMAQQKTADDAITDVDQNSVFGRMQASTITLMQANFEANADRRNKIFDHIATVQGMK